MGYWNIFFGTTHTPIMIATMTVFPTSLQHPLVTFISRGNTPNSDERSNSSPESMTLPMVTYHIKSWPSFPVKYKLGATKDVCF